MCKKKSRKIMLFKTHKKKHCLKLHMKRHMMKQRMRKHLLKILLQRQLMKQIMWKHSLQKTRKKRQLKQHIEKLHKIIASQYAENLGNPQTLHRCRYCSTAVSQICPGNVEDPESDNPQHRVHSRKELCIAKPSQEIFCDKCGKKAKDMEALECHKAAVHSKFRCDECPARFNLRGFLEEHEQETPGAKIEEAKG